MHSDTASTFNFKCPQCGEQVFKFGTEPHDVAEAAGGICVRCSQRPEGRRHPAAGD